MYGFFAGMEEASVQRLLDVAHPRDVDKGEEIIREGVSPRTLMWVDRGVFEVRIRHLVDPLAYVGAGAILGEVSFVSGKPAVATVVALEPSRIQEIPFDTLKELLQSDPHLAADFYRCVSRELANRLRANLSSLPVLELPSRLVELLEEFKAHLAWLEGQLRRREGENLREEIARISRMLRQLHDSLDRLYRMDLLGEVHRQDLALQIRAELLPYVMTTDLLRRAYTRPRGIAGDYLTLLKIYRRESRASEEMGQILDRCALELPFAHLLRQRKTLLQNALLRAMEASPHRPPRVVALFSGPAQELWDLREAHPHLSFEVYAVDVDREALAYVEAQAQRHHIPVHTVQQNALSLAFGKDRFPFQDADVVYSTGLLDVFPDAMMTRMVHRLHPHVRGGGTLLLGGFLPQNPSRAFLEWVLDWNLHHRSEEAVVRLLENTPFASPTLQTGEGHPIVVATATA